jgi:hypothetical protein
MAAFDVGNTHSFSRFVVFIVSYMWSPCSRDEVRNSKRTFRAQLPCRETQLIIRAETASGFTTVTRLNGEVRRSAQCMQ